MRKINTTTGNLYIGANNSAMTLAKYSAKINFDVIWNLADELSFLAEDQQKYTKLLLLGKIKDYSAPADTDLFKKQLSIVVEALRSGKTVFIHCLECHGRTGTALAAIVHKLEHMPMKQAIQFALDTCNGPEVEEQKSFLLKLT